MLACQMRILRCVCAYSYLFCSNDGAEFGGSIYQKVNDKLETAVNLAWSAGSNNTRFGIAAKYQLDDSASISVSASCAAFWYPFLSGHWLNEDVRSCNFTIREKCVHTMMKGTSYFIWLVDGFIDWGYFFHPRLKWIMPAWWELATPRHYGLVRSISSLWCLCDIFMFCVDLRKSNNK